MQANEASWRGALSLVSLGDRDDDAGGDRSPSGRMAEQCCRPGADDASLSGGAELIPLLSTEASVEATAEGGRSIAEALEAFNAADVYRYS